jgi:hypothetical protein
MRFNQRPRLASTHAFLSPSSHAWVNYTEDKFDRVWFSNQEARRGTELHAFASEAIRLGVKLPDNGTTLSLYVNDAIGYRMTPEQVLYYSDNCYGHADAIAFRHSKLRVHDLKTGVTEASPVQLELYAAIFCLEYNFKPLELEIELRIYQNDEVRIYNPTADVIFHLMDRIVMFDRRINALRLEV